ncbi:unnamed protein product [Parajaminaea phylloscopi]
MLSPQALKNERLAQALAANARGKPHDPLARPALLQSERRNSSSSGSEDQFKDVADELDPFPRAEAAAAAAAPGASARQSSSMRASLDTTWDEGEFQMQAADRSSRYSAATRYDGDGVDHDDDTEGNDAEVDARSTYGHARSSSVGSSIWAGRGVVGPTTSTPAYVSPLAGGSNASKNSRRKPAASFDVVPPLPTSSAAFQHYRGTAGPSSPAGIESAGSYHDLAHLDPADGHQASSLLSAYNSPNPATDAHAYAGSPAGRHDVPGEAGRTHPPASTRAKAHTGRSARSRRSPVLSFDGGAAEEELALDASKDGSMGRSDSAHRLGVESTADLERRISHLGPKVRKNEPAPWELEGDDASEIGSLSSSLPYPSSPLPQSTWSKLTRGSLDVRDRDGSEGKRVLGLGVNLRRPSSDLRRPSADTSRSREPSSQGMSPLAGAPISPGHRSKERSKAFGSSGSVPPHHAPASAGEGEQHDEQGGPSQAGPDFGSPARSSHSVATSSKSARARTKSMSSSAANVLKGLGLSGDKKERGGSESGQQSNKLAKALKKKGEKNELSLAKGISSADYGRTAPVEGAASQSQPAATVSSSAIRAEANKNLINPFVDRPTGDRLMRSPMSIGPETLAKADTATSSPSLSEVATAARLDSFSAGRGDDFRNAPLIGQQSSVATASSTTETRSSTTTTNDTYSTSSLAGANVSHSTESTCFSEPSREISDKSYSSGTSEAAPATLTSRTASQNLKQLPSPQARTSPVSTSPAPLASTPTRGMGLSYRKPNHLGDSQVSPSAGDDVSFPRFPPRKTSTDSYTASAALSPKLRSMALLSSTSTNAVSQPLHPNSAPSPVRMNSGESIFPAPHDTSAHVNIAEHDSVVPQVRSGHPEMNGRTSHAVMTAAASVSSLPSPGSHQGVSYRLISLEQAQAQAKAKQRGPESPAAPLRPPLHRPEGSERSAASDRAHESSISSERESVESSEKSQATARPLRGKKSGILKGIFTRDKQGSRHTDDPNLPTSHSQSSSLFPSSQTLKSMRSEVLADGRSDRDRGTFGSGSDATANAKADTQGPPVLGVPSLGTIRPVSSMFGSLSSGLLETPPESAQQSASAALDPVQAATLSLEGKVPVPPASASNPAAGHLAVSRGHSPAAITPPEYRNIRNEGWVKEEAISPGDGSSIFHSPATSPAQLNFPDVSARSRSTSSSIGMRCSNEETAAGRPVRLLPGSNLRPSNDASSADGAAAIDSLSTRLANDANRRSTSSNGSDASGHLRLMNGFPAAPGSVTPERGLSSETSSQRKDSFLSVDDAVAVKRRVCEIESRIADLVGELTHLRVTYARDGSSSGCALLTRQQQSNDDTADPPSAAARGEPGPPSGLEQTSPIPACQSCGCSCAEMKRLQALNESHILREIGSSVMDRGRGIKKRSEEAASRFGGR